ncbi:MAG TPA: hypothetical protein VK050_07105 [Flavobacteriaceae bacterium]|nr:hypothetical protein [Flavobacteriaceae bacterium]
MKYILLLVLLISSLALIYLGITNTMQPPIWTGVGFLAIAGLFLLKSKKQS